MVRESNLLAERFALGCFREGLPSIPMQTTPLGAILSNGKPEDMENGDVGGVVCIVITLSFQPRRPSHDSVVVYQTKLGSSDDV